MSRIVESSGEVNPEDCPCQMVLNLPETWLSSFIPDPFSLPDLIIQVYNEIVHKSPFCLRSKMSPRGLQYLSELLPC